MNPSRTTTGRSPNAMPKRVVDDRVTEWLKAALRFVDRCSSDAADYTVNGLQDDAEYLIRTGFEFFGLSENNTFADLERAQLSFPAPVVSAAIKRVLDDATGELLNLHFNLAGPRTYEAIDRLEDLRSALSKTEPQP